MKPVTDALGQRIELPRPACRIVSLVPSETESVAALAGLDRLRGRTEWCEEPAGRVEAIPTVGGTKKIDVDAVLALAPDLVLANKEENGRRDVERLIGAGLRVHVSLPQTADGSAAYLESLAALLDVDASAARTLRARLAELDERSPIRVFAPIWREPWMTFDERTYGSDLLRVLGAENVFARRPRRFPLAADLGDAAPVDPGDRDTRYPRASPGEIAARRPALALLPDEPYRFGPEHVSEVRAICPEAAVELVSGKDLFWYGVRTLGALDRLGAVLDGHRAHR